LESTTTERVGYTLSTYQVTSYAQKTRDIVLESNPTVHGSIFNVMDNDNYTYNFLLHISYAFRGGRVVEETEIIKFRQSHPYAK